MILLLLQLEKMFAKPVLQAHTVEVRYRLTAYSFVKCLDFGLFKCMDPRVQRKAISPGPCVRFARHGMKEISTGMTLLLHSRNTLRALFGLRVGIDSGSSALEINVTGKSMSMCPRDLSGIQHHAALPASHRLLSPPGGLDHLDLSALVQRKNTTKRLPWPLCFQISAFSIRK